jgi:hypothetical protein
MEISSMSNTAKQYKTSIVPQGEEMVPARKNETIASSLQIEVLHIGIFVFILYAMFAGIWKAAAKQERDEENKAGASGLNHK